MIYYGWTNGIYMKSISHGIQNLHAVGDLAVKYRHDTSDKCNMLWDWLANHKTVGLLDARNYQGLLDIVSFLDTPENPYPWGVFHEDVQSLNGLMTCVGIVLPARIYETAKEHKPEAFDVFRQGTFKDYTDWEIELMKRLPTYRSAQ